jgi:hypothetical protein
MMTLHPITDQGISELIYYVRKALRVHFVFKVMNSQGGVHFGGPMGEERLSSK